MKHILIILSLLVGFCTIDAQNRKILTSINSIVSHEQIEFKYDSKNQLKSLTEKSKIALREFSFRYDKEGRLLQCNINRDKGGIIRESKYTYADKNNEVLEVYTEKGRLVPTIEDSETLYLNNDGFLSKILFDDGRVWEQFEYDSNNNLVTYKYNSATDRGTSSTFYKYDNNPSPLSGISLPRWFWAHIMTNTKWCADFIGTNNAAESFIRDLYKDDVKTTITYDYDADGYPTKQYYNQKLVREFSYR